MRLGFLGDTQIIPPDLTKDIGLQTQACVLAGGTWMNTPVPNSGCQLNTGATLPSYCNWVPFATSLFADCALPTSPADLAAYGSYTDYKIGVQSGLDAEKAAVTQTQSDAVDIYNQNPDLTDCNYVAAAGSPGITQMFGPSVARMLTNPSGSNCTGDYTSGWLLYAALGVGAWFLISNLMRK